MRDDIVARYDKGVNDPVLDATRRAFADVYESQRLSRGELKERQLSLASRIVEFASSRVPVYQTLYGGVQRITNWNEFKSLPILERSLAADSTPGDRSASRSIGMATPVTETVTSGTTGKKVVTTRSLKFEVWRAACRALEYDWAGIDPRGRCLIVRSDTRTLDTFARKESRGQPLASWEEWPMSEFLDFGVGLEFPIGAREEALADALSEDSIDYIITTPTTLETLIPYLTNGYSAKKLFTIGEMLHDEVRQKLELAYGANAFDVYGTRETGRVAANCPDGSGYHVHDLNVIVEIVDDEGKPCDFGAIGHVLITSLHNYASPMIRYRVGDLASISPGCRCGRTLTHVPLFEGREVNRLLLRGGRKRIARTVSKYLQLLPTVENYKILQRHFTEFEIVIDGESVLSDEDCGTLQSLLEELVEERVSMTVTKVEQIPPLPSGKRSQFTILFTPDE